MLGRTLVCLVVVPLLPRDAPAIDPLAETCRPAAIAGPTAAARRRTVAERFAPTLYQEVLDPPRDFIAAFDFDGDWDGANNRAHVASFPLRAALYYTVVETATHWFVQYLPYHPTDYKRIGGHAHDTESILLAVRKLDGGARLEAMETRFHKVWYQYAAAGAVLGDGADDVDGTIHLDEEGRPAVNVQRVGHGLCGGLAPLAPIRELELLCDHRRAPAIQARGVVYRFTGAAELPSPSARVQTRGYALVEMGTTLWAHRGDPRTCGRRIDYLGERCATPSWHCPHGLGAFLADGSPHGDGAELPWGQTPGKGAAALGEQFFDPALTLGRRLRFAAPYALDYEFNPFLGIGPLPTT